MTLEQMRIRLGLKPCADFEYEQLLRLGERTRDMSHDAAVRARYRQIGKTTHACLHALHEACYKRNSVLLICRDSEAVKHAHDKIELWTKLLATPIPNVSDNVISFSASAGIAFAVRNTFQCHGAYDVTICDDAMET